MAPTLPYTYFQCPCASETVGATRKIGDLQPSSGEEDGEDERDFDPRARRANYNLYSVDYLLYCVECQKIRCPRCVLDEIVTWYCPNCLFEVPSSTAKTEGNREVSSPVSSCRTNLLSRCTRSCFQCPECTAPLSVSSLEPAPTGLQIGPEPASQIGPWVLACSCCNWSSKEIGIRFEKPNGIYSQLARIRNGGEVIVPAKERALGREDVRGNTPGLQLVEGVKVGIKTTVDEHSDAETRFANLRSFYQSQLADTAGGGAGDYSYGSPGSLSRIMGLYTGAGFADKKSKSKSALMREAHDVSEGLVIPSSNDETTIQRLQAEGWSSTSSLEQRRNQLSDPHFVSDLRPVPYLLRTKRSKRCRTCRHILSKPDAKVQSTRYKIRLVAGNYIPSMSIKALSPPLAPSPSSATTTHPHLTPLKTAQFLLTMKNLLFDPVKITLATPTHTPGRFASKVTILCPQFEIGAFSESDVWDEALQDEGSKEKRRDGQAEAGKVWEKGRSWVTVVVEVVPASLMLTEGEPLGEDEDVLEIPVFVRVEWDATVDEHAAGGMKEKDVKESRELAYWSVLGVGRIAQT